MRATTRPAAFALALAAVVSLPASSEAAASRVKLKSIVDGFERPLHVTNDGGRGRVLYVAEQEGLIQRVVFRRGAWRRAGVFLDISGRVLAAPPGHPDDLGLLGLVFHPGYARNGRFYVYYTRDTGGGAGHRQPVVAEFRRQSAKLADPTSERIVLVITEPFVRHHGGHLAFGPDRHLYVSVGDGRTDANGQDEGTLLGSLLRIGPLDPDGDGPKTYSIPRGNPNVGRPGELDEIWAHGLRNPWRYSFDRRNGNLWIGDVGENVREEVDRAKANRRGRGAARGWNFGWADCEGTREHSADEGDPDEQCSSHRLPLYDYAVDRAGGWCSVIGGHVHRGPDRAAWRGLYVAADFCGGLFVLDRKGRRRYSRVTGTPVSSIGEDAAGRLFATAFDGHLYRLVLKGPRP